MIHQTEEFKQNNFLEALRQRLKQSADPKTRENGPKFFKERVKPYGVSVAAVTKISREFFEQIKDRPKREIFALCECLWQSGYLEESFIAGHWSYYVKDKYDSGDFAVFENWLKSYVDNWASCDTLCNHTIGALIEQEPRYLAKLVEWTKSENRWLRRGAAVALIIPARKGEFLKEILHIADQLLLDKDDLVQKGYGWMLKAASEAHEKEIFAYVMKNKTKMPRTALRYALEKMPKALKTEAMKK